MLIKASESDREIIMNFCAKEPSINLFIIGDIELYGFDKAFQEVWFQKNESDLSGVVLRYHNNFIIYGNEHLEVGEIKALLETRQVDLISGKASSIKKIVELFDNPLNVNVLNFAELKSDLKLIIPLYEINVANIDDAAEIAKAYEQINEFDVLYPGGYESRYNQIYNRIKNHEGQHMFIKEDGMIISHANTAAENSLSAMIGGVMTLETHRQKQYAKSVVSRLCHELIQKGKRACLFYRGEPAEHFFHSLGFEDIDQWMIVGGLKNE